MEQNKESKNMPKHMINRFLTKLQNQLKGELVIFSTKALEKLDMGMQKN